MSELAYVSWGFSIMACFLVVFSIALTMFSPADWHVGEREVIDIAFMGLCLAAFLSAIAVATFVLDRFFWLMEGIAR